MSNHIVVGANLGDEGKGLVTDYLANKFSDSIVIRFNGGGQAAHTVELEDGRRHVFRHMGSGTLRGVPTLLSEHFIVNPGSFNREYIAVPQDHIKVFAHRQAMLTTPYDWLLNQRVEEKRGEEQHGTCGMGINETVTRVGAGYGTFLSDIFDSKLLKEQLSIIRDTYVPKRAKELDINPKYIMEYNISDYLEDCDLMSHLVIPVSSYNILNLFKNKIFEGAQGLMLDEYHRNFPHVTRSRTGVNNATQILKTLGQKRAEVHYVTRTYLTRHGNGPLPFEGEVEAKEDNTNKHNADQGTLRFAPLNLNLLKESITNDLENHSGLILNPSLKVTWGQLQDDFISKDGFIYGNKLYRELMNMLPITKQTWFYSPVSEE